VIKKLLALCSTVIMTYAFKVAKLHIFQC